MEESDFKTYILHGDIIRNVTNKLCFSKIPHYEDSQEGLIRHLADMDIRVKDFAIAEGILIMTAQRNIYEDLKNLTKRAINVAEYLQQKTL
ncbi:MAG: hypothetical protein WC438_00430 [Candidatus Pacearchaeota archaeon]